MHQSLLGAPWPLTTHPPLRCAPLPHARYAGSKIRLNGPRFLVYAIVDSIVDELFPVLRNIRKKVCICVRVCG